MVELKSQSELDKKERKYTDREGEGGREGGEGRGKRGEGERWGRGEGERERGKRGEGERRKIASSTNGAKTRISTPRTKKEITVMVHFHCQFSNILNQHRNIISDVFMRLFSRKD